MNKEEALKVILSDIKQAKNAKKDIDSKIETWIAEYDGQPYGEKIKGRSNIVVKDIKKAVEWFIPNAIAPFVDRNRIIKLEGVTYEDVAPATVHERLLNYQFVRKFDRYNFIHDMFKVGATEGTTVIRVGWELEEEERVEVFENLDENGVNLLRQQGFELKINENNNGTYTVRAKNIITKENYPTAQIVRNGNFFPDPSVDNAEEMSFAAYRYETTLSELRETGKYDEEDLEELVNSLNNIEDSSLENLRNTDLSYYGRSLNYESEAKANKKVTVYEYWGHLDLNGDGISESIMATIVNDKLLEITENPYPDGKIPFIIIPFSKIPFSLWGYPIAELISDNQKVRSSLMRGFIDNVAQSNNGKKFIKKGSLDPINKKKYENNLGGLIEFNINPEMIDGNFNQLPPSIFNLYELVQQEAEALSGINRMTQGIDSSALNDSATGAAIQRDMGQKRMIDIIRRYSEGLKQLFRHWIAYNKEFLTDKEVMRISGEFIQFKRDDISGEFDIDLTVGVAGVAEAKVNQMTMLMQQVGGLAGVATIPPNFFNMMLGKIADEWGYADIAKLLEESKQEGPSEAEVAAQQMQMQQVQADIQEKQSKAELNKAKTFDTMSSANSKNVDNKMKAAGIVNQKPFDPNPRGQGQKPKQ